MYVQPNQYNISMNGNPNPKGKFKAAADKAKQAVLNKLPDYTFNDTKKGAESAKNIDTKISNPALNRLIMGGTAIVTQPVIDYYNHRVDEETREVSRNRTIAKIIAGTTVGILVRGSAYKLVKEMTNLKGKGKYAKSLIPKTYLRKFVRNPKLLKNYQNALSTTIALLVMCITNFVIDAPLTTFLTNKFNADSAAKRKANAEPQIEPETEAVVLPLTEDESDAETEPETEGRRYA